MWPGDDFTLSKLLQQNILEKLLILQDISDGASREYALERQLDGMQAEWAGVEFELMAYGRLSGFILKGQVSSGSGCRHGCQGLACEGASTGAMTCSANFLLLLSPSSPLQSVEEAQMLLDDHTIKSQAMISSPAAQVIGGGRWFGHGEARRSVSRGEEEGSG